MLSGLMMDYQLTIDRVLEHGNRLYPYKKIKTSCLTARCTSTPTETCTCV